MKKNVIIFSNYAGDIFMHKHSRIFQDCLAFSSKCNVHLIANFVFSTTWVEIIIKVFVWSFKRQYWNNFKSQCSYFHWKGKETKNSNEKNHFKDFCFNTKMHTLKWFLEVNTFLPFENEKSWMFNGEIVIFFAKLCWRHRYGQTFQKNAFW